MLEDGICKERTSGGGPIPSSRRLTVNYRRRGEILAKEKGYREGGGFVDRKILMDEILRSYHQCFQAWGSGIT